MRVSRSSTANVARVSRATRSATLVDRLTAKCSSNTVMIEARELKDAFRRLYGANARAFRAPGRVNLIGEHTDYNDGFVMPVAIDLYAWVAIGPRADRRMVIRSEEMSEAVEFDLDEPDPQRRGHWSDYPRGVAVVLERAGHPLRGADLLIRGEVPQGSGLSSSAALEVATAYALLSNSGATIDPVEMARLCQRAENEFVGIRCGLMDQFIACRAEAGRALMLDCRSLEYTLLPVPLDVRLVICNTMVKHEHASSQYNARRAECEEGVRILARTLPHVRSLRDVTSGDLERFRLNLSDVVFHRCKHVVGENARVLEAAAALERADFHAFGRLMGDSHRSLRDDYEVSCAELDLMVDLAGEVDGVYGARMTGGGFGGCTINLVSARSVTRFKEAVARGYEKATGLAPKLYTSRAGGSVEEIS
ncbi:MAG: galactokinase [Acidobacteriota bacterium]